MVLHGRLIQARWLVLQDAEYEKVGARIAAQGEAFGQDIVLKVRPPSEAEAGKLKEGST